MRVCSSCLRRRQRQARTMESWHRCAGQRRAGKERDEHAEVHWDVVRALGLPLKDEVVTWGVVVGGKSLPSRSVAFAGAAALALTIPYGPLAHPLLKNQIK